MRRTVRAYKIAQRNFDNNVFEQTKTAYENYFNLFYKLHPFTRRVKQRNPRSIPPKMSGYQILTGRGSEPIYK